MAIIEEEQAYMKTTQLDKLFKMQTSKTFGLGLTSMTAKGDMEQVGFQIN